MARARNGGRLEPAGRVGVTGNVRVVLPGYAAFIAGYRGPMAAARRAASGHVADPSVTNGETVRSEIGCSHGGRGGLGGAA